MNCVDCSTLNELTPARYVRIRNGRGTARAICAPCAARAAVDRANFIHDLTGVPNHD